MTAPILFTTGTPHGEWATWVRSMLLASAHGERLCAPGLSQWLDSLADVQGRIASPLTASQRSRLDALAPTNGDATSWGGLDFRAAWVLAELLQSFPEASVLVFVESPALALARALSSGQITDIEGWLDGWRAGAQRLLQQAHRHPARFLLVDATEALGHPQALAATMLARFAIDIPASHFPRPSSNAEPLADSLAAMLAFRDARAQAVLFELQASCALLCADDAASVLPPALPQFDGEATVGRLQALLSTERALTQSSSELGVVRSRVDQLNGEIAALGAAMARQDAAAKHDRAEAVASSDKLLADVRRLTDERDKAAASLQERQLELHNTRQALESLRKDSELLSLQLAQASEELDALDQERQALRVAVDNAAPAAGSGHLHIGAVGRGHERATPPHREATFVLRDVKADDREMREVIVRLVEHNGHPGLSIFGTAGQQLVRSWRETGREADYPYELIVPSDASSKHLLDSMGSADWHLLQALIARLERHLASNDSASSPMWRDIARRLRQELQELPRRFRYESVSRHPAAANEDGTVTLCFTEVQCGAREMRKLTLDWQVSGEQAGLIFVNDGETALAFSSWPVDDQGGALPAIHLPLGSDPSIEAMHRAWSSLQTPDREFILAMLAAWPEATANVASEAAAAANTLLPRALEALNWTAPVKVGGVSLGQWLRRLVRRGRGRGARAASGARP